MKNYLKFVVAVFGITIATFSSLNVNAKEIKDSVVCRSYGFCGTATNGAVIEGQAY